MMKACRVRTASSMTWLLEFVDAETEAGADAWYRFDAGCTHALGETVAAFA